MAFQAFWMISALDGSALRGWRPPAEIIKIMKIEDRAALKEGDGFIASFLYTG
jgi:hypothetical protein